MVTPISPTGFLPPLNDNVEAEPRRSSSCWHEVHRPEAEPEIPIIEASGTRFSATGSTRERQRRQVE
ncbi:hypothetical protein OIU79_003803 [Salix purpurea]|uniref:Uncharacterized protein n=1 Tax=Salix purpurea TaxID=77065 RepID=A0A9Q0U8N3_SALPP|nr:hypothetical protein OIU79_003803 [Salix purpurea]